MNPDPLQLAYWECVHAVERQQQERNQARLHRAAVARRRKAKRGGKR